MVVLFTFSFQIISITLSYCVFRLSAINRLIPRTFNFQKMGLSWYNILQPEEMSLVGLRPSQLVPGMHAQIYGTSPDCGSCRRKFNAPQADIKKSEVARRFRSEFSSMEDSYEIRAELPGVAKEGITVSSHVFSLSQSEGYFHPE